MKKKAAAGARFFITPPVFDPVAVTPFLKKAQALQVAVIPTVLLLKSLGMARYMAKNMGHIAMPDDLIKRIQKAPDKVRECTLIAAETVRALKREGFSGVMIATIGWEHKLPEILERV